MRHSKIRIFLLVALVGLSGFALAQMNKSPLRKSADSGYSGSVPPEPLAAGPNDGNIAYVTARLLEEYHYSQHPFDTEMSERFFDAYLDAFDPQHAYFLQSDLAEFSHYRTNLDVLTLGGHSGSADVTPAYQIANRFRERLHERADCATQLLKHDNFKFNSDQQVQLDRKDAPYPKNLDEAKELWRQQLMMDFLREKLDREDAPDSTLAATNFADITQTLQRRYDRELRAVDEWDSTDVLQVYLDSLARAYDPHSDYLSSPRAQDFSIQMSLALFGIGAELTSDDGVCKIENLVPGGPAAKSNQLKPNDKIIAVAQGKHPPVDVIDMELPKIVQLIRGQKGTEVRLTIIPVDDPKSHKVVTLIRDEINLRDQQSKAQLIERPDSNGGTRRIGVISVPSFYAPVDSTGRNPQTENFVSHDVATLVKKLMNEKADGIILDLRGNPGGSLEEAVHFVGLFVTNGPVVQVRSPDESGAQVDGNNHAPDIYHGPLIVLVNRLSASASEIVAAALQDYGRALIVGDTSTFGKGTVQNLDPLRDLVWPSMDTTTNDPGMAKITIRKFYRIDGASTQFKGVVPDIVLPDVLNYSQDLGENSLPNALPWDTTTAADYAKMDCVQPYLDILEKNSRARVATNEDFKYVKQDITELQKLQDQKTDTLNERKAWDEKETLDAEKKTREKEIAARALPDETAYELIIADANKPGLPPPVEFLKDKPDSGSAYLAVYPTNSVDALPVTNSVAPDPMLDETKRIMQDYISLRQSNLTAAAAHE